MAKVKYVGKKRKIHIPVPVGAKSKSAFYDILEFSPGAIKDMDLEDAEKLVAHSEGQFVIQKSEAEKKATAEKKKEKPKLARQEVQEPSVNEDDQESIEDMFAPVGN